MIAFVYLWYVLIQHKSKPEFEKCLYSFSRLYSDINYRLGYVKLFISLSLDPKYMKHIYIIISNQNNTHNIGRCVYKQNI